ncbi:Rpn family recombination-promoting nuclease/putative transposase [Candidiatus Paracoxiella cheracis]|uniref:Rpn family recombination-promoting nuclease/putative transposase n=1 Tax=Candidiatus Paracoxiella cheracis TaxID=3405120 RepID=UPI003BF48C21
MVVKIHNPHDHYFRKVMSDKRVAMEFFEHYLPKSVLEIVDLKSLKLQKSSFIDESLQASMADMLYTVNFRERSGYLYILVEHQRKPDKSMSYRLLRYQLRIIDLHLKGKSSFCLPVIVPIVFYNGSKPYFYSTNLFDLFGEQKYLAKQMFLEPFTLIDLTEVSDDELKAMQWMGVMGLVQKNIGTRDFMSFLKDFLPTLKKLEKAGGQEYLSNTLTYLFQGDIEDLEKAVTLIQSELSSKLGDEVMTLAERLEQKGFARGEKVGFESGERAGFEKGKQVIAQHMLQQNIEYALIAEITGLTLDQIKALV